jgi:hypothetical protein
MPWPVHPNGLLGAQGDNDAYKISRSLRLNPADTASLTRTPSTTTNQTTWTLSAWAKRSALGSQQAIFAVAIGTPTFNECKIVFTSDDKFGLQFQDGGGQTAVLDTTQVFRDISAWYHIIAVCDTTNATASNRLKIYINGNQLTSFSTSQYPSQNASCRFNGNVQHAIGSGFLGVTVTTNGYYFNGYLAEFNFIDGQALTPSSFGETDVITGRWKAKAYSGTYGTNGFYVNFTDNSGATAATLGKDQAGSNNWTPNNLSVTAGVGNDSLVDSPTNYGSDSYNTTVNNSRGNYNTFNSLSKVTTAALTNGNLDAGASGIAIGSIGMSLGKWYWEVTSTGGATAVGMYGASATSTRSVAAGATEGFRFDSVAATLDYTTNGTTFTSIATGLTSAPYFIYVSTAAATTASLNCGQRIFAYNMPSGYKTLCTTNLQIPTIQKPSKYMDVLAYTGTGASNSISSFQFSPDLVWIKNRGGATSHAIYDTTRGTQSQLSSDTTGDQITSSSGLTAFGSNGFTISTSTLVNTTGTQYVAWAWDQAAQNGFTISTYTGTGANATIAHTLGVAPKMLIVKATTTLSTDQGWPVWHTSIANTTYLQLNSTTATATGADYWNSTSPTSTVFSVGTNAAVNALGDAYIAYAFAEVDGFSKIGSYSGNALADGTFVYCGFLPSFVLIKSSTAIDSWLIYDNKRNTFNVVSTNLVPNTTAADATISGIDFVSNGFKLRTITTTPNAAQTYIFAAFAEAPFKYARAR